ncbi:MAG: hypothetical protein ACRCY9_09435 [Phycicoccus sp.]
MGSQTIVRTAAASGANAVASIACVPAFPYAVGGGVTLADVGANTAEIVVSIPTGGSTSTPATGWQAGVSSGVGGTTVTAHVICSK